MKSSFKLKEKKSNLENKVKAYFMSITREKKANFNKYMIFIILKNSYLIINWP